MNQTFEAEGIEFLRAVVSSHHVHIHIEYVPNQNISSIFKSFKGKTSRNIKLECRELKQMLRQHFWASGYSVWSTGNITNKRVNGSSKHHRIKDAVEKSDFILE